ncbi:MAG TPA: adenylate kinase [Acidimicrobiales bacterium]|nr:adenylate kinase [Acidimicrobiales bacterium]
MASQILKTEAGDKSLRAVLLGRQGSGKGTQAARLAELYQVPHVSTGDAFRAAVRSGNELGSKVHGYMERGELVPDELVSEVVRAHLFGPGAPEGFLLDGFPRTVAQAEALEAMAGKRGLDIAINLDAPISEVLGRLAGRRICRECGTNYNIVDHPPQVPGKCDSCGGELYQRDDDTEEAIRRRLEIYETSTAPLIAWYEGKGLLATVDAVGTPDEVSRRVVEAVEAALEH